MCDPFLISVGTLDLKVGLFVTEENPVSLLRILGS